MPETERSPRRAAGVAPACRGAYVARPLGSAASPAPEDRRADEAPAAEASRPAPGRRRKASSVGAMCGLTALQFFRTGRRCWRIEDSPQHRHTVQAVRERNSSQSSRRRGTSSDCRGSERALLQSGLYIARANLDSTDVPHRLCTTLTKMQRFSGPWQRSTDHMDAASQAGRSAEYHAMFVH